MMVDIIAGTSPERLPEMSDNHPTAPTRFGNTYLANNGYASTWPRPAS